MMLQILPLVCLANVGYPDAGKTGRDNDFVISVEVVSALEGGPLVLRIVLSYQGSQPINVYPPTFDYYYDPVIKGDDSWKLQPLRLLSRKKSSNGRVVNEITAKPGDRWETIYYLHHDYRLISAGENTIQIEKPIFPPAKRMRLERRELVANPSLRLTLEIPKATPERLNNLAKEMEACLSQATVSQEERTRVANIILRTQHARFIPTALLLLRHGARARADELIEFVYERSLTPTAGHAAIIGALLEDPGPESVDIFNYWRRLRRQASLGALQSSLPTPMDLLRFVALSAILKPDYGLGSKLADAARYFRAKDLLLSALEIKQLSNSRSIWVRAMTQANFPAESDAAWAATLMAELGDICQPFPENQFRGLIADLNDKRFPVRERAAADLLRRGDVVAPALHEVLKNPPTSEVEQRVKRILADIEKTPLDPLAQRSIAHLASLAEPNSAARSMLEVLARGAPGTRLTEEARKALEAARQRPPK